MPRTSLNDYYEINCPCEMCARALEREREEAIGPIDHSYPNNAAFNIDGELPPSPPRRPRRAVSRYTDESPPVVLPELENSQSNIENNPEENGQGETYLTPVAVSPDDGPDYTVSIGRSNINGPWVLTRPTSISNLYSDFYASYWTWPEVCKEGCKCKLHTPKETAKDLYEKEKRLSYTLEMKERKRG